MHNLLRLHYTTETAGSVNSIETAILLSPLNLKFQLEELFKTEGEICIYKPDFYKQDKNKPLIVNLVFYFNLFQLPFFPLALISDNPDTVNIIVTDMLQLAYQAKQGKIASIHKLSTIRRLDTMTNLLNKKQTLNKQDTLTSLNDSLMSTTMNQGVDYTELIDGIIFESREKYQQKYYSKLNNKKRYHKH